jgi:hypothetical protein
MADTKETLQAIQKHHFWILTVVVLITAVVCWWLGTAAIKDSENEFRTQRESTFTQLQNLISRQWLANSDTVSWATEKLIDQSEANYLAWQELYADQQPVFTWPAVDPIVAKPLLESGDYLRLTPGSRDYRIVQEEYLERFLDQRGTLKNRLNLLEFKPGVNPEGSPDGEFGEFRGEGGEGSYEGEGPGSPNEDRTDELTGIVAFPGFDAIFQQYPWLVQRRLPTMSQIRYAQEDIWIYKTLFSIIAATNGDVSDYRQADVKQIEVLEIGAEVPPPVSLIMAELQAKAGGEATPGGGEGAGYGEAARSEYGGPTGEGGEGTAVAGDDQLTNRRYLDSKNQPIPSGTPPDIVEYRKMPFRLVLSIRQSALNNLLTQLVSAELPATLTSVQLFPLDGAPTSSRSGGSFTGGYSGEGGRSPSSGQGGGTPASPSKDPQSDMAVEIRGFFHIFNPPTLESLPEYQAKVQAEQPSQPPVDSGTSPARPGTSVPSLGPGAEPADEGAPVEPTDPTLGAEMELTDEDPATDPDVELPEASPEAAPEPPASTPAESVTEPETAEPAAPSSAP